VKCIWKIPDEIKRATWNEAKGKHQDEYGLVPDCDGIADRQCDGSRS